MKPEVLVTHPTRPHQMAMLEEAYTLHRLDLATDKQAMLAEVGPRCEGMVTFGHVTLGEAMLAQLPSLKIVSCGSVGYDTIDVPALTRAGVRLTNTPDVLTDDVADTALMLLLAARRRLLQGDAHVRTGEWGRSGPMPLTRSTAGKTVGIVGLGRIGSAIAKRCEALGLVVGYYGRSEKPGIGYRYFADVVALAEWSDILIAATSGGAGTRAIVSAAALEALGPEGSFINIARGSVVDEPALIAALTEGRLGTAGLDVFENEPHPDPAFRDLENVVLYPHHASGTEETRDKMAQLVVDNLAAHFAGRALLTPVN